MVNEQQLKVLKQGVVAWNQWRMENPKAVIELQGADLIEMNLVSANLDGADLAEANLTKANLSGANLQGAMLSKANLSAADLTGANLRGAFLNEADLFLARGLTQQQIDSAGAVDYAKLPTNIKRRQSTEQRAKELQDLLGGRVAIIGQGTHRTIPSLPPASITATNKSPVLAAVMSFILFGGSGQIYLGQWKKGLALIMAAVILTPCANFIIPIIPIGNVFVLIFGVGDAYGVAQKLGNGNPVREWEFNINWKVAGLATMFYAIIAIGIATLTK